MSQIETPQIIPEFEIPSIIFSNPGKHTIRGDWKKFHEEIKFNLNFFNEFEEGNRGQLKVTLDQNIKPCHADGYCSMKVEDENGQSRGNARFFKYTPDNK